MPKRIRDLTSTRVDATFTCLRTTNPDNQEEPQKQEMFSEDKFLEESQTEFRKLRRVVFDLPEPSMNTSFFTKKGNNDNNERL